MKAEGSLCGVGQEEATERWERLGSGPSPSAPTIGDKDSQWYTLIDGDREDQ